MGLSPGNRYYVIVRAVDQAGNRDGNTTVVFGDTALDITPPAFAGLQLAQSPAPNNVSLTWAPLTKSTGLRM